MPLIPIKVKIDLKEYLEDKRKFGFLYGTLEALRYRVDDETKMVIDEILKEVESDRFKYLIYINDNFPSERGEYYKVLLQSISDI
jgi:hypothetical protein